MNYNRHPASIGSLKDLSHLCHVVRIIQVDVGIAEVQLEPTAELFILGAPRELVHRVRFQRIEAAKDAQPITSRAEIPTADVSPVTSAAAAGLNKCW